MRKGKGKKGKKMQSLLFDMLKSLDNIESNDKSFFFSEKAYFPYYACATCFELPCNISIIMILGKLR